MMTSYIVEDIPRSLIKFACIDQSYAECGIAIFDHGTLVEVNRLNFKMIERQLKVTGRFPKRKTFSNRYKRLALRNYVRKLVQDGVQVILVERVRTFSRNVIATYTILALGELIATIIDAAPDIQVFSMDTRAWKARSVGNGKATKEETIKWAEKKLMTDELRRKRDLRPLTDNEADAIGMGAAFLEAVPLVEEE